LSEIHQPAGNRKLEHINWAKLCVYVCVWFLLVLQMQVAEGGLPQYMPSCHFPNSLWTTFPLWSVIAPSTSFMVEFQYFACKGQIY